MSASGVTDEMQGAVEGNDLALQQLRGDLPAATTGSTNDGKLHAKCILSVRAGG
jgi:hypothetical protein